MCEILTALVNAPKSLVVHFQYMHFLLTGLSRIFFSPTAWHDFLALYLAMKSSSVKAGYFVNYGRCHVSLSIWQSRIPTNRSHHVIS